MLQERLWPHRLRHLLLAVIRDIIVPRRRLRRQDIITVIIISLTGALREPGSMITGVRLLLLRDRDCRRVIRTIITITITITKVG